MITGPTGVRASNMIAYFTPNTLGGFAVHYGHYFGENPSGTPTEHDGTGDGIRVTYGNGPFFAGIATSRTRYAAGDARQSNAAASYDFGPAKLVGAITHDSLGTLKARGTQLGLVVPFGPGEFKATYSTHKTNAAGSPEGRKYVVGYVYNLSKRTALYGTLARVHNEHGLNTALNGATTAANQPSTGLDLGVRVSF
jgi:predicted porin